MAFDGITFDGHILKVRRPKDYNPNGDIQGNTPRHIYTHRIHTLYTTDARRGASFCALCTMSISLCTLVFGMTVFLLGSTYISSTVPDSPNKIFIGSIPYHFTDEEVITLLTAFGDLKAFYLVRDTAGCSKAPIQDGISFLFGLGICVL